MEALLTQNSDNSDLKDANAEQLENAHMRVAIPSKPSTRASKREALWNPKLVRATEKSTVLAKMWNYSGKPCSYKKYRVQKLKPSNSKKQRSPRNQDIRISPRKTLKRKQAVAMSDDDFPTPRNCCEKEEVLDEADLIALRYYEEIPTPRDDIDVEDISPLWTEEEDNGDNVSTSEDNDQLLTVRIHPERPGAETSSVAEFLYLEDQTMIDESFNWQEYNAKKFPNKDDSQSERSQSSDDCEETPGFRSQKTSTDDLYILRKASLVSKKVPTLVPPRTSNIVDQDSNRTDTEDPEVQYGPHVTKDQLRQLREERHALEMEERLENARRLIEIDNEAFRQYLETRRPAEYYAIRPSHRSALATISHISVFILILLLGGMSVIGICMKCAKPKPIEIPKPEPLTIVMTALWHYFRNIGQVFYFYN